MSLHDDIKVANIANLFDYIRLLGADYYLPAFLIPEFFLNRVDYCNAVILLQTITVALTYGRQNAKTRLTDLQSNVSCWIADRFFLLMYLKPTQSHEWVNSIRPMPLKSEAFELLSRILLNE